MPRLQPLSGFEPTETLPPVEVLIVGAGETAASTAKELVDAGMEVVCLERGAFQHISPDFAGNKMFDELKVELLRDMLPQGDDLYITFRDDPRKVAEKQDYHCRQGVGGAGEHWGGSAWRINEEGFKEKSKVVEGIYKGIDLSDILQKDGAAIADWPVTYEEVEPFYEKYEYEWGVGGRAGVLSADGTLDRSKAKIFDNRKLQNGQDTEEGGDIFQSVRRKPYPYPPLRDSQSNTVLRKAMLEMGLSSFHHPTAYTSRAWTSELGVKRAGCSYCCFCAGYGCWNGSKSTPLSAMLPYLQTRKNFKIRTGCDAFRVNTIEAANGMKMAKSVDYFDASGKVVRQPAHIVILAALVFQNVRILLNSGLDGNITGTEDVYVGKYYMTGGEQWEASVVFDKLVVNAFDGPLDQRRLTTHFDGENDAEFKLKELLPKGQFFLRGGAIGDSGQAIPLAILTSRRSSSLSFLSPNASTSNSLPILPPDMPGWGAEFKEYLSKAFIRRMSLGGGSEPLPYEDKYLDLDPTHKDSRGIPVCRVTHPLHENERRSSKFFYQKAHEILTQVARMNGGGRIYGHALPERQGPLQGHHEGGARMGSSPLKTVTNRYGQMWQVPNLFPVGGDLFPSKGTGWPTETITMISAWVGSAIAQKCVDLQNSENFRQTGPEARRHGA
jgi:gluconate 2-dehydrogenase alpha chain